MHFSCKHGGHLYSSALGQSLMVISTTWYPVMQKYVPFIMYCGNALLLFTCKVQCSKHFVRSVRAKFLICTYYDFLRYWEEEQCLQLDTEEEQCLQLDDVIPIVTLLKTTT